MADATLPTALIVIDVQDGFDEPSWGPTTNQPGCEENIARLLDHWRTTVRGPVVIVRHDSAGAQSPLNPAQPGNQLKAFLARTPGELLVTKSVNSAFYGQPDLHNWLTERGIASLVICGIQTNMCVETTARMAGNLGYQVTVPWDATRTFDLSCEVPGLGQLAATAEELIRAAALNLQAGGFASITATDELLAG
jgi:nicotinamidase-related amidase